MNASTPNARGRRATRKACFPQPAQHAIRLDVKLFGVEVTGQAEGRRVVDHARERLVAKL